MTASPAPSTRAAERPQTLGEEIANSVSHGVGLLAALAAYPVLVYVASKRADAIGVVAVSVFATTMILLYLASTLFHALPPGRAKRVFQVLDHAAIFLMIAGTYTPFTLLTLPGRWGAILFALVWTLALAGISLELRRVRNRVLMATLYVALGWIGLVAIGPLTEHLPATGLWLLFGGGAAYTLGVPFYLWKRLPYSHALWHVFVLLGSVLQFFAVLLYVLPRA